MTPASNAHIDRKAAPAALRIADMIGKVIDTIAVTVAVGSVGRLDHGPARTAQNPRGDHANVAVVFGQHQSCHPGTEPTSRTAPGPASW